ncbi:MAG: polyprenyl synthetase family protein [Hydrogenophaga sp.]|nr:polyprenyl synthetase family protein [Hydrogenophaga sp.]
MQLISRIEQALEHQMALCDRPDAPPRLMRALRHAVFPGGARIRPQLCLAVAAACGEDAPDLSDATAVAIELLHCASLVHDDMPCFDDADSRRGLPSVHRQFGEPLALLAGDALIVMAYQSMAMAGVRHPSRLAGLLQTLCDGVGAPTGIVAGQAWECESHVALGQYQRAKTGALFVASTRAGALAAGADPKPWQPLGEHLGEAYQVADDIRDVMLDTGALGKPAGQDVQHGRPSAAAAMGIDGAVAHFRALMDAAVISIPDCPARSVLQQIVRLESERLIPSERAELRPPAAAGVSTQVLPLVI